jgi:hypothetical protein
MNGTVRGFTNDGVRSLAQYLVVSNMLVTGSGRYGVFADPAGGLYARTAFARVAGSTITASIDTGILCADYCRVENSQVSFNGASGILFIGIGGFALGNSVVANTLSGMYFSQAGGTGNNTVLNNGAYQIGGSHIPMQPNACVPVGCGLPPP